MYTLLGSLLSCCQNWFMRHSTRRALRRLSDERLDDLGISRQQANLEAAKPFWRQ